MGARLFKECRASMKMSDIVHLARILRFCQKLKVVEAKVELFVEREDCYEVVLKLTISKNLEYPLDVIRIED